MGQLVDRNDHRLKSLRPWSVQAAGKTFAKGRCVVWLACLRPGRGGSGLPERSLLGLLVCHGHLPRSLAWAVPVWWIGCRVLRQFRGLGWSFRLFVIFVRVYWAK